MQIRKCLVCISRLINENLRIIKLILCPADLIFIHYLVIVGIAEQTALTFVYSEQDLSTDFVYVEVSRSKSVQWVHVERGQFA